MSTKKAIYKVKANEFEFSISNDQIDEITLIQNKGNKFNIIKDNRSVNIILTRSDLTAKKLTMDIDGETYEITIKDELDLVLEKMGFDNTSVKHIKEIKAPMPGLVLEIAVKEGDELLEGDSILILQAMKMENNILVHTNAKIKRVAVTVGQAVEKGQLLAELE